MLCLSRLTGESIDLMLEDGREVKVLLVGIDYARHVCRIGIEAPKTIRIIRTEIRDKPRG